MSIECVALFTIAQKCFKSFCAHNKVCSLSKLCTSTPPTLRPVVGIESSRGGLIVLCDSFDRIATEKADELG